MTGPRPASGADSAPWRTLRGGKVRAGTAGGGSRIGSGTPLRDGWREG